MKALYLLPPVAVASVILLPWQVTLALTLIASFVFPPTALLVGALTDALYSPYGLYHASLFGALLTAIAYGVRWFVKRNMIGG